jgi:hypothetical protein
MILAFTPRKAASGAFPVPLAKAGDVIIFPGVRYEQDHAVSQAGGRGAVERVPDAEGSEPRH